jgi:ribonuclease HI
MFKLVIYTDGGARGNPGPAAIGVVIYDEAGTNVIKQLGEHIGDSTNNHAEYMALIRGLNEAVAMGARRVDFYLDSELVVKQLLGKYKIREENLQKLAGEALRLARNFESVEYFHVPREKNKLADKLVNEALDKAGF